MNFFPQPSAVAPTTPTCQNKRNKHWKEQQFVCSGFPFLSLSTAYRLFMLFVFTCVGYYLGLCWTPPHISLSSSQLLFFSTTFLTSELFVSLFYLLCSSTVADLSFRFHCGFVCFQISLSPLTVHENWGE